MARAAYHIAAHLLWESNHRNGHSFYYCNTTRKVKRQKKK